MSAIYYVYAHLHDDGQPYYIGKGKAGRAYRLEDNSRVLILLDGLTERTAHVCERILIQHYGRIDIGTGILDNKTNGGEGAAGHIVTEATKDKTRASVLALRQTDRHVSASCVYCRKTIRTTPEAIAANIEQHIYYKHKDIASSYRDTVVLAPVSCVACKRIIKANDYRFERHYLKHKSRG
jgi:hypothetical protein